MNLGAISLQAEKADQVSGEKIRNKKKFQILRSTIIELVSFLLVLLFMYAAISKLLDYQTFKLQLSKSPFITHFAGVTAWALPIGEILVGVALTFKRTRLLGLYSSLFLMAMFTVYIYTMLHFSYNLPCSCGGILSKMGWVEHLWFNIFFVLLPILGILLEIKTSSIVLEPHHR